MALTHEEKQTIAKLYEEGNGYKKIATEVDVSRDVIRGFVRSESAKSYGVNYRYNRYGGYYLSDEYIAIKKQKESEIKQAREERARARAKTKEERKRRQTLLALAKELSFIRECETCGSKYYSKNGMSKYCSDDCKYETRVCEVCSDEYRVLKNTNQTKCSKQCDGVAQRKPHYDYVKEIFERHGGMIVPLETYKGKLKPIKFKCLSCGHEFKYKPESISRGKGCPECMSHESRGERRIKNFLVSNGVPFKREVTFDDLKHKARLRYDFAIYEDKEIKMLIEYDGRQHYESIEHLGGDEELKRRQRSDMKKDKFAKHKGIELLRISHQDFDEIENILGARIEKRD